MIDAIAAVRFSTLALGDTPWHPSPVTSTKQIRALVARIGKACFIVVAFLIGACAPEILGHETGCVERHPSADGTEQFA